MGLGSHKLPLELCLRYVRILFSKVKHLPEKGLSALHGRRPLRRSKVPATQGGTEYLFFGRNERGYQDRWRRAEVYGTAHHSSLWWLPIRTWHPEVDSR